MNKKGKRCMVDGIWYPSISKACECVGAKSKSVQGYHERHPEWTIEKCIERSLTHTVSKPVFINNPFTGELMSVKALANRYHVSSRNLRNDFLAGIPITKEYFGRKTSMPEFRVQKCLQDDFKLVEGKDYRHDVWLTTVFNGVPEELVGLRIDFVILNVKRFETIAIEVDGEQHIYPKMRSHTDYISGIANDVLKENFFYSHKIPLLRIHAEETADKGRIIAMIREFLKKPKQYILDKNHNLSTYHALRNKVLMQHGVDIKKIEQNPVLFKNKDLIHSTHLKPTIDPFSNISYSTLRYLCDSWNVDYKQLHCRINYTKMNLECALAKALREKNDNDLERLARKHEMSYKELIKAINKNYPIRKKSKSPRTYEWSDKKGVLYIGLPNIAKAIGCKYNTLRALVNPSYKNLPIDDAITYVIEHGLTSNL